MGRITARLMLPESGSSRNRQDKQQAVIRSFPKLGLPCWGVLIFGSTLGSPYFGKLPIKAEVVTVVSLRVIFPTVSWWDEGLLLDHGMHHAGARSR